MAALRSVLAARAEELSQLDDAVDREAQVRRMSHLLADRAERARQLRSGALRQWLAQEGGSTQTGSLVFGLSRRTLWGLRWRSGAASVGPATSVDEEWAVRLNEELDRIAALEDPVEREATAREIGQLLAELQRALRVARAEAVVVSCQEHGWSVRDAQLVLALSHMQVHRLLRHGRSSQAESA